MVHTETIRTAVGIIGNVISFFLFLSPVPTFVKIIKQKAVEEFKPDPYIATLLNCAMLSFYGMPFIKPDNILVLTINAFGLFIEFLYISIFFLYSPSQKRKRISIILIVEVIFMAAMVLITMYWFPTATKRATFVGILCIVFNIIMYAAPLTVMKMVIQTKSVKYMPFYLSLANFCNGLIWVAYSLLEFDINIVFPNGLGAFSGLIQLILYAIYYKTTNWDEEKNSQNKSEVQMSKV